MDFSKQKLLTKYFSVVDIGSYKIRAVSCSSFQKSSAITGYAEKRQESNSFFLWEPQDFESICDNIAQCLEKAEKWNTSEEIIVNLISPQFYLYTHQINHVRENENTEITDDEIVGILETFEKKYIEESYHDMKIKSGYTKDELELIFSSISDMTIDGKKVEFPVWKTWRNIKLYLVNIFIPKSYYTITKRIFTAIGREKFTIIPFEYAVLRSIENIDSVVVNIWNTKTYIGIKKDNHIIWTTRINIGIGDLIKIIQEKYNITQIEAIKNIDNSYEEEKKVFLDIFEDCITLWIEEIIWREICPSTFLVLWWGGNNQFIKNFFKDLNLLKHNIKILKEIELIDLKTLEIVENGEFLETASNYDIFASILTYTYLEKKKNDFLSKKLEKVIANIKE